MMLESGPGLPLVDTNVLIRFSLLDHMDHSARSIELFTRLRLGLGRAHVTETVIFETVFVMQSFYAMPREGIRDALMPLFLLPTLFVPQRSLYPDVFELYVAQRQLSFADCFHAVLARDFCAGEILSFNREFDRVLGATRIEPPLGLGPP